MGIIKEESTEDEVVKTFVGKKFIDESPFIVLG